MTTERSDLSADMMVDNGTMPAPVANEAFEPGPDAGPPRHALAATLRCVETPLSTACGDLAGPFAHDGDPRLFPAVTMGFVAQDGALIPTHRGLHRRTGGSYWDLMVGLGRVWSEPGDRGMSRAAFPFQLSNEHENDSHHGPGEFSL